MLVLFTAGFGLCALMAAKHGLIVYKNSGLKQADITITHSNRKQDTRYGQRSNQNTAQAPNSRS
jgi:hypothetical protein